MADQFEPKKQVDPVLPPDFYRFICAYYFHQDSLSWSRTQNLLAVEAGILAVAFSKRGGLAILALTLGSVLVLLILHLILRDWQVRDQYLPYFDKFHEGYEIRLTTEPKGYWYRGSTIVQWISWSLIAFNLASAIYFLFEICPHLLHGGH